MNNVSFYVCCVFFPLGIQVQSVHSGGSKESTQKANNEHIAIIDTSDVALLTDAKISPLLALNMVKLDFRELNCLLSFFPPAFLFPSSLSRLKHAKHHRYSSIIAIIMIVIKVNLLLNRYAFFSFL